MGRLAMIENSRLRAPVAVVGCHESDWGRDKKDLPVTEAGSPPGEGGVASSDLIAGKPAASLIKPVLKVGSLGDLLEALLAIVCVGFRDMRIEREAQARRPNCTDGGRES